MAATHTGPVTQATVQEAPSSSAEAMTEDTALPRLREDIRIQPGPRDHAGRPTWTLFDPIRNKFFQLDERAFQIVCCWDAGTAGGVVKAVASRFPWKPAITDVAHFFDFLAQGELLRVRDGAMRRRLQRVEEARQQSLYQKLVHNYLFFRVPLVRPDPWLGTLYPKVAFLLTSRFLLLSALVGLVSLVLLLRQWETFAGGFLWFFSVEGAIVFSLTLAVVKILHEMGHALACRKYGVRVATMGVSFIVMWPVLYTDATDGWRLTSRRQRAIISAAGVTTELVIACYALAAWLILPEGLPRSVAFTAATTTLVTSLLVNLNPMMRFDGYFFLSDTLNMPNLQERSFALARWRLRTTLFGDIGPPPERLAHRLHLTLLAYAFSTWLYRLILFLGIALLVYHLFFKALGVFLFFVEIWYFIARPIYNEMKAWPGLWSRLDGVRRRRWYAIGGALALLLLFPWRQDFLAQAQWVDARFERIHPVRSGQVESVRVKAGETVQAGQVLMRIVSPKAAQDARRAALEVQGLRSQLERSLTDRELSAGRLVMEQALQRAEAEVAAMARVTAQLTVVAPFAGQVEDLMPEVHTGRWVSPVEPLMTVREAGGFRVTALVNESEVGALAEGGEALFYADGGIGPQGVPLVVTGVERSAVTALDSPYFAVQFQGEIPASQSADGKELVPEVAVYRVHLALGPEASMEALPGQRLRGWVRFEGQRKTLAGRVFRSVASTLIREAGF